MANQTVKDAIYIKGTNPQYLVEKIIRTRIYDCRYWNFALTGIYLIAYFPNYIIYLLKVKLAPSFE